MSRRGSTNYTKRDVGCSMPDCDIWTSVVMPKDYDYSTPTFTCGFCSAKEIASLKKTIEESQHDARQQEKVKPSYADLARSITEPVICATLVREVQAEEKRQHEKSTNLVIKGLAQTDCKPDADILQKLATDLSVEIKQEEVSVKRTANKEGLSKSNVMIVTFKNLNTRNALLRKGKELRHLVEYKDVYINPDLTKAEQAKQFELRCLLRQNRKDHPDKRWYIRNNQVMSCALPS